MRSLKTRYHVACWHRRARKTTGAINTLIENCCTHRNKSFGYVAPTFKQAKSIAVVDPNMLKKYLPKEVCKKPFNETELRQEFITGSVLEIKGADDPDSIRGVGWYGVVIEEWAMMKHGRIIWEEILRPVLAENGGWAIFIFTPKGRNFAYEYFERARKDTTGTWGYSILKASESKLIDPTRLADAKKEMPERLFNQEFECDFLDDASSVFHGVDKCVCGELKAPVKGHRYSLGVDLGRVNDFTVITIIDCSNNSVVYYERFTDVSWYLQKEKIVYAAKRYNNAPVVIDATGFSAGSVIAEEMKEAPMVADLQAVNLSVIPFNFSNSSKKALVEKMIIAIEQRLITFPKIDELVDELKAFTYEITQFGNVRYTAPEGLHDDSVMSLGLAIFGLGAQIYTPYKNDDGDEDSDIIALHRAQAEFAVGSRF
jgi:hypothetical protein